MSLHERKAGPPSTAPGARERFKSLDPYRVDREWRRYEGTAQRDLFRELRVRFLRRHSVTGRWAVDVGSGPGRFLPHLGPSGAQRVALDLSLETLHRVESPGRSPPHLVRGDGTTPPFARAAFSNVAVLGNALGFAGDDADRFLEAAESLVAPGGVLLLEVVAGPGERSRYLNRLPPRTLTRLLRSPVRALQLRTLREGFVPEPPRRRESGQFTRFDPADLATQFQSRGWEVREVVAVAPALGASPAAIEAARSDAKAWTHLLEMEEVIGRMPERWTSAAAVLLSFSAAYPPENARLSSPAPPFLGLT
ncbi:MAG: methyltransferase domain-containing protein [Thermoplasmata archaeon]